MRGETVRVRKFEVESDGTAVAFGADVRSLTAMELWEGDRKVRHWDAFPPMGTDD